MVSLSFVNISYLQSLLFFLHYLPKKTAALHFAFRWRCCSKSFILHVYYIPLSGITILPNLRDNNFFSITNLLSLFFKNRQYLWTDVTINFCRTDEATRVKFPSIRAHSPLYFELPPFLVLLCWRLLLFFLFLFAGWSSRAATAPVVVCCGCRPIEAVTVSARSLHPEGCPRPVYAPGPCVSSSILLQ